MVLYGLRIAWAQQGLKDMTGMSGLRQDVPQERQSDLTRLARSGARRIQCAAHRPPREGVVTHSVVVRQIKQARQVNSHIVEISCQDRPRMGLLGASQACKNWQELPRGHAWNHFGRPNTSRRHHTGVLKRFQRVSGVSWGCLGSSRQDPKMLQRSKK